MPRKQGTMNERQKALYESYKRGWVVGASGTSELSQLGTSAPASIYFFKLGMTDGRREFTKTMQKAMNLFTCHE